MGTGPQLSSAALWTWSAPVSGTVTKYSSGANTKTGLQPSDLRDFVGVPLQTYGNPPVPMQDPQLLKFLRWAEDDVETKTGLLLCQSWVASPPARTAQQCAAVGITPVSGSVQQLGADFDIEDAAYDFMFPRAQDEGWMIYSLRYRPVKSVNYSTTDTDPMAKAIKKISYVYPLLNEFFAVPPSWIVEDHDFGLVRLVPAENVQMLPLFAMQLAFMGFAESVPGGIWMQYTAGLTRADYNSRYSFIQQLVLASASIRALATAQGSINLGVEQQSINIDGVQYQTRFNKEGAFKGLITEFTRQRDELLTQARDMVGGPIVTTL